MTIDSAERDRRRALVRAHMVMNLGPLGAAG
jgi:hypothetical protein